MGYWGMTSFLWSFFKWFFNGDPSSSNCGFSSFPTLGLSALAQSWSFDFSLTYIGVGESSPFCCLFHTALFLVPQVHMRVFLVCCLMLCGLASPPQEVPVAATLNSH